MNINGASSQSAYNSTIFPQPVQKTGGQTIGQQPQPVQQVQQAQQVEQGTNQGKETGMLNQSAEAPDTTQGNTVQQGIDTYA